MGDTGLARTPFASAVASSADLISVSYKPAHAQRHLHHKPGLTAERGLRSLRRAVNALHITLSRRYVSLDGRAARMRLFPITTTTHTAFPTVPANTFIHYIAATFALLRRATHHRHADLRRTAPYYQHRRTLCLLRAAGTCLRTTAALSASREWHYAPLRVLPPHHLHTPTCKNCCILPCFFSTPHLAQGLVSVRTDATFTTCRGVDARGVNACLLPYLAHYNTNISTLAPLLFAPCRLCAQQRRHSPTQSRQHL